MIGRFFTKPQDFKYSEAKLLLKHYNYREYTKGKTSGSRVSFIENDTGHIISIHKPHSSGDPLLRYQLDLIEEALISTGKFFPEKPKVD